MCRYVDHLRDEQGHSPHSIAAHGGVGDALALYLRDVRGPSRSRRVFLRHIAPRVGLSQPSIVAKIAREALQCAGLLPHGRVGGHIFRHSLATRMMRRGAALAEISQVLRHRSTVTTQLYAKVDFEGLRSVALPMADHGGPAMSAFHDALKEYLAARRALGTPLKWPEHG